MRSFHRAGLLYGSMIGSLTASMPYFTCFCNKLYFFCVCVCVRERERERERERGGEREREREREREQLALFIWQAILLLIQYAY